MHVCITRDKSEIDIEQHTANYEAFRMKNGTWKRKDIRAARSGHTSDVIERDAARLFIRRYDAAPAVGELQDAMGALLSGGAHADFAVELRDGATVE
eukprot:gene3995-6653_t